MFIEYLLYTRQYMVGKQTLEEKFTTQQNKYTGV